MVGFNFISSIQRGMGDSKTPSLVAAAAAACQHRSGFSCWWGGFDMGAGGAGHRYGGSRMSCRSRPRRHYIQSENSRFRFRERFPIFRAPLRYIAKVGTRSDRPAEDTCQSVLSDHSVRSSTPWAFECVASVGRRPADSWHHVFMLPTAFRFGRGRHYGAESRRRKEAGAIQSLRWGIGYALALRIFCLCLFPVLGIDPDEHLHEQHNRHRTGRAVSEVYSHRLHDDRVYPSA